MQIIWGHDRLPTILSDGCIHSKSKICRSRRTSNPTMTRSVRTGRQCKLAIRTRRSVDATEKQGFSCHASHQDELLSSSHVHATSTAQEQRLSIAQHSTAHQMAEQASAGHLTKVYYRAERQRRVPRRGQIKSKIAHIVVRSIASALLRAFSQLPVLDQK
jgi:hypothetical protein